MAKTMTMTSALTLNGASSAVEKELTENGYDYTICKDADVVRIYSVSAGLNTCTVAVIATLPQDKVRAAWISVCMDGTDLCAHYDVTDAHWLVQDGIDIIASCDDHTTVTDMIEELTARYIMDGEPETITAA